MTLHHELHAKKLAESFEILEQLKRRIQNVRTGFPAAFATLLLICELHIRRHRRRIGTRTHPQSSRSSRQAGLRSLTRIVPPDRTRIVGAGLMPAEAELSRKHLSWRWRLRRFVALDDVEVERLTRPLLRTPGPRLTHHSPRTERPDRERRRSRRRRGKEGPRHLRRGWNR
jgi:hypothetical protein